MTHETRHSLPQRPQKFQLIHGTALLTLTSTLVACGAEATGGPATGSSSSAETTSVSPTSTTTATGTGTSSAPSSTSTGQTTSATSSTSTGSTQTSTGNTTSSGTNSETSTAGEQSSTSTGSTSSAATDSDETDSDSGETTSGPGDTGGDPEMSAGCGGETPESGRFSIDVNGEMREYIIAIPEGYDANKPYRLVFAWHPWGGSAEQVAGSGGRGYYGLEAEANGEAIFVSPDGLDFGGNGQGWGNEDGKDLAFFDAMLERFKSEACIDTTRVFSTGFSFGGMMSWAVGCGRGDVVRAIAPMAGNTTVSGCLDGDSPVAVMGFHGVEDTVVSIEGGRAGRDEFIARNNCGEPTPSESTWCDGAGSDPCTCTTYEGCDEGYPVTWCEFNGPHTPAPNSAATIWNFFAQF